MTKLLNAIQPNASLSIKSRSLKLNEIEQTHNFDLPQISMITCVRMNQIEQNAHCHQIN